MTVDVNAPSGYVATTGRRRRRQPHHPSIPNRVHAGAGSGTPQVVVVLAPLRRCAPLRRPLMVSWSLGRHLRARHHRALLAEGLSGACDAHETAPRPRIRHPTYTAQTHFEFMRGRVIGYWWILLPVYVASCA